LLADLDFARVFDRLIIGPSQYSWAMYEAFVDAFGPRGQDFCELLFFSPLSRVLGAL